MASAQKISQLTTAGPLTGAELVPVVQNGGTLQTTVSVLKTFSLGNVENEVSLLNTRVEAVSALATQNATAIASIQTSLIDLNTRVDNVSASVSVLNVQMVQVQASISAINSLLAAIDISVINTLVPQVSALEVRVSALSTESSLQAGAITSINSVLDAVSARTSVNAAAITSINNVVSALEVRVSAVSATAVQLAYDVSILGTRVDEVSARASANSAAITSINNVVSALEVRVSSVSALTSANTAAIISTNAVIANVSSLVSALDIRVAAVSSSVSALQVQVNNVSAALTSTNNVVSALEVRVSAVSAAVAAIDVSALEVRVSTVSAAITSINAVVSLKVFRNGDHLTNVQYIDFNTTTSYAVCAGRLTWDIESGTLDLGLTGTVNLLIGQRTVAQVYNNSGVTLPKGKAVKVTGAQGQRLTGALAQADSDSDSMTIFGIMLETVSNLGTGYVATDGLVKNVDTAAYSDGDIVYLSPVSAGELTPVKPIAPQHLVQMGYVVKGGSVGGGSLYIKVQNGYEIGELHNVKTSADVSISDGEVLAWNASASVWTNSTALIATQASVSVLQLQVNAVSAALTSTNNVVSALEIRVSAASATGVTNAAAITSINNVVSALEIRVSAVSARASAIQAQVNAVSVSVSVLQVQVNNVSAALTSTNNVVSALEIRVSTVSAQASAIQSQINAVSVLVSTLDVRVAAVSASVSVINARLPSGTVVGTTDTQTLTDKRINPRVVTTAGTGGGSITPTSDTADQFVITALTSSATFLAPSGTPVDGQKLIIRIKDNGVSRALVWTSTTAGYRAVGATIPVSTSASKTTYVGCIYNGADLFWDVVAVATQV